MYQRNTPSKNKPENSMITPTEMKSKSRANLQRYGTDEHIAGIGMESCPISSQKKIFNQNTKKICNNKTK